MRRAALALILALASCGTVDERTAFVVVTPRIVVGPVRACGDLPDGSYAGTCLLTVPLETTLREVQGVGARILSIRTIGRDTRGMRDVTMEPWVLTGPDLVHRLGTDRIDPRRSVTLAHAVSLDVPRSGLDVPGSYDVQVSVWTLDTHGVAMEWSGVVAVPSLAAP